jgi:hypothetical protein
MSKEWLNGILTGASFPDLKKAAAAKGLKDLLAKVKPGESIFEPVNDKKKELEKQYRGDFKAAVASHGVAVGAGNKNSCADKKQFGASATKQQVWANQNTKKIRLPSYGARRVAPKKMPKTRGLSPVATASGRQPQHPSIARAKVGALNTQTPIEYKVETITPQKLDGKDNFKHFVAGQAGFKGKVIDKALTITHDGTPQYGDDEINQANQDNVSANLANTPPTLDFPSKVSAGATIDANQIARTQPGQIQDKGDTVGNILKLGAIGVALTALLFLIRDIIGVVSFVVNIASLSSTVTNIAQTFLAIFDGIGSLLGLGDGISKPIGETFDGILNNIFGKDKVEYVKYNLARINAVFTAGANILGNVRSTSAALASGIEQDAQNTSKIGNALRRCGVVDERLAAMDEAVQVRADKSQIKILNEKLAKVSNVSSGLSGIAGDLKTAKDELTQIEKDKLEKEKAEKEQKTETGKAEAAATGKPVEIPTLSSGGI